MKRCAPQVQSLPAGRTGERCRVRGLAVARVLDAPHRRTTTLSSGTVEDIVAVMHHARDDRHGRRERGASSCGARGCVTPPEAPTARFSFGCSQQPAGALPPLLLSHAARQSGRSTAVDCGPPFVLTAGVSVAAHETTAADDRRAFRPRELALSQSPGEAEAPRHAFVSSVPGVRFCLFVSWYSPLGVRLRRRTGRRPAAGPDLALRLGLRGRGSTASRWTPFLDLPDRSGRAPRQ